MASLLSPLFHHPPKFGCHRVYKSEDKIMNIRHRSWNDGPHPAKFDCSAAYKSKDKAINVCHAT